MVQKSSSKDLAQRIKQAENRQNMTEQTLAILNMSDEKTDTITNILSFIKQRTGIEATGIRLKENEDFPYYHTSGFPEAFVEKERYLCQRDKAGNIVRDSTGNPHLECMCGNVICGRTNPSLPFFTEGGSFWTNSTTELLATFSEKDRQTRTRNRCNGEGYESVSLIPLHTHNETIGLLQLNDHRKGMFSYEMITLFEKIGASIGIGLMRKRAENALKKSNETAQALLNASTEPMLMIDLDGTILALNSVVAEILGKSQNELVGMCCYDFFPPELKKSRKARVNEVVRAKKAVRFEDSRKGRIFDHNLYPLFNEDGKVDRVAIFIHNITERRKAELRLKKNAQLLEIKNQNLKELNAALKVLLEKQQDGSKELEENILLNFKQLIMPYLTKLKNNHLNSHRATYLDIIESHLKEIISPFAKKSI